MKEFLKSILQGRGKALLELAVVFIAVLTAIFATFNYMEERHAAKTELELARKELEAIRLERLETELRIRGEEIKRDLKRDAVARDHYRKIRLSRALEPVEVDRMEYLEEQMAEKIQEHNLVERNLSEVKMKLLEVEK